MAAEVGEHLPALDDLIEEVVELDDEAVGSWSQHPDPAIDDLRSLGEAANNVLRRVAAAHGDDPVQVFSSCPTLRWELHEPLAVVVLNRWPFDHGLPLNRFQCRINSNSAWSSIYSRLFSV